MTGLPLTSRLGKSQTSYPSNLKSHRKIWEVPLFSLLRRVCPFFSRTEVLNSVSHRIIMIYTSLRCVLKISLSLIKIRSHLFGKPVLVCRTLEKASTLVQFKAQRKKKKKRKYMRENTQKHVFLKTNYAEIILQKCI